MLGADETRTPDETATAIMSGATPLATGMDQDTEMRQPVAYLLIGGSGAGFSNQQ